MEVSVDTAERKLEQREARTLPMPPGVALGLGGCLTVFVAGMGFGLLTLVLSKGGAMSVALVIPLGLLVLTLGLVVYGARGLLRRARARKRAALHPGEPWYEDWDWDPAGVVAKSSWVATFGDLPILAAICAMFSFLFFRSALPSRELTNVVKALFAFVIAILDLLLLRTIYRRFKDYGVGQFQGPARLHFGTFPFLLGRLFEGRLTAKALAGLDDVVVTLRCLEERYVTHKTYRSTQRQLSVGVFQLHEARQAVDGGIDGATVSFLLPDADLGTHLSRELPRYWELEVEAKGADPIRFLVPVYRSMS